MLTSKQKVYLKGLVHGQKPAFQIGKNGITEITIKALNDYIVANELLKLKINEIEEDETLDDIATELVTALKCELVGTIGKHIILFKRNPQKMIIELPKRGKSTQPKE